MMCPVDMPHDNDLKSRHCALLARESATLTLTYSALQPRLQSGNAKEGHVLQALVLLSVLH
jgi:hypothetical protein